jgi:rhomboid protease GluP
MLKMGASSYNSFVSGRWYEIITAMFLHFGVSHLFNNMLLLVYIGCELEKRIGPFVYAIIYLGSGIVGNAASLLYYSRVGEADVVSAGASGAIFGVMGCLAVYLLINPSKNRNLTTRRLIIMALLTIYYGFSNVGVDNAAHIGGFCFGIFGGFLLSKILHYDKIKLTKFYGREGSFIRRK